MPKPNFCNELDSIGAFSTQSIENETNETFIYFLNMVEEPPQNGEEFSILSLVPQRIDITLDEEFIDVDTIVNQFNTRLRQEVGTEIEIQVGDSQNESQKRTMIMRHLHINFSQMINQTRRGGEKIVMLNYEMYNLLNNSSIMWSPENRKYGIKFIINNTLNFNEILVYLLQRTEEPSNVTYIYNTYTNMGKLFFNEHFQSTMIKII